MSEIKSKRIFRGVYVIEAYGKTVMIERDSYYPDKWISSMTSIYFASYKEAKYVVSKLLEKKFGIA